MARAFLSRKDRSENQTDESQLSPDVESSSLSRPNVEWLQKQFCIPEQFQLFTPRTDGWVNNPPLGQMAFYVEDLRTDH